jgi:hypothetical protein
MEIEFDEKAKTLEEQQDARDNGMSFAEFSIYRRTNPADSRNRSKRGDWRFPLMSGIDRARDLPKTVRHDKEECRDEIMAFAASARSKMKKSQKQVRTIENDTVAAASAPAVAAEDRAQEKLEARSAQDQTNDAVMAQDEALARIAGDMSDTEYEPCSRSPQTMQIQHRPGKVNHLPPQKKLK